MAGRGRHLIQESAATVALTQRAARGEAGLLRIGFGIATILGLVPRTCCCDFDALTRRCSSRSAICQRRIR